jgi:hypothetical protein
MANIVTIEIDGQSFPLPEEIAKDDLLLKAALGPFVPWMANAQINRIEKDGAMKVNVLKQADWKGNARAVLDALISAPEERNPAIKLWSELQERRDLNDPGIVLALEPTINEAITLGKEDIAAVRQSLQRLVESAPVPAGRVVVGF